MPFHFYADGLLANGILPNRGSIMLDFVFIAMMAVIPVQAWSIWLVKFKKRYALHRNIQIGSAVVLFVTIVAFEIDLQLFTQWRELAVESTLYESGWVDRLLYVHLLFAVPTPFLWAWVLFAGAAKFWWLVSPNHYSKRHRFWGRTAAFFMLMTSVTGWTFYLAAFVF